MELPYELILGTPIWMWAMFVGAVIALLALDLGFFHRTAREVGVGESLRMSGFYVAVALAFGAWSRTASVRKAARSTSQGS